MTATEAAAKMVGCKKFMVMTGAGISAASGIPTFRGENDGFWKQTKKYANLSEPSDILTRSFFDKNPMAVWEWIYDFLKLAVGKTVNPGHTACTKFQEYIAKKADHECIHITQNIDNLYLTACHRAI